jgi:dTDP-4-dehydrorhamnose reductase
LDDRSDPLQLWGGAECTIARLGGRWRDQAVETGHSERRGDVDLIAGLGISALRFPILWESIAPDRPDELGFSRTDEQLAALREQGVGIIGGLLHHGSGPVYTDLLDPDFAHKFADYAARVAEHYPWIEKWTPINEPLTTARFSGLYGHWYPHERNYPAFLRALVNQCEGIRLGMAAIRRSNPAASLIQTEDLGKTFSTAPLQDQAAHENERRWLSLDLLAGRVDAAHPLHPFLLQAGIREAELDAFRDGAARPDMIGVNHYLTSERYLDHRTGRYPDLEAGGNGRQTYVDLEAIRVEGLEGEVGLAPRLRETWDRYRIPLAITEVHHGCTREEQLRWLIEVWRTTVAIRDEGVDLRAMTIWSLFGCCDWRSLLTRHEGAYDVGPFDIRSSPPRPTVLAKAARALARHGTFDHPVLDGPGWWRRPSRLYGRRRARDECRGRKLLITGATGTLGRALARIATRRGLAFHLTGRAELDICDPASVEAALDRHRPWAIVNAAGFVRVADAEAEHEACMAANSHGPALLARACADAAIPFATLSSDLVFDGRSGAPRRESDPVAPACVYGLSKALAERAVSESRGEVLIVRTSAFFGPWDRHNFGWHLLRRLGRGEQVSACADTIVSPTFVPDLCHAILDLLIDGETGIWHLANQGEISWFDFAHLLAGAAGLDPALIVASRSGAFNTALASERGVLLRPLDQAVRAFTREYRENALPIAAE